MQRGFFGRRSLPGPQMTLQNRRALHLAQMVGADAIFVEAKALLASGRYLEAYNIYRGLAFSADKKIADRAVLSLAYCSFYMNRFLEASNLFTKWLNDNFDAPESAEAQADLRQCLAIIAQYKEWEKGPYPGSAPPARSGLIVRFLNWAGQKLHGYVKNPALRLVSGKFGNCAENSAIKYLQALPGG